VDHEASAFFESGSKLRPDFAEAYLTSLALSLVDIMDVSVDFLSHACHEST